MSILSSKTRSMKWLRRSSRRQAADRRELLRGLRIEPLEERQLLTGSPKLAGVTTNDNTLLEDGEVLRQSPRELTFRFNRDASLDPSTYGGIQVVRSGGDGLFSAASAVSDFGSNSAVTVEFMAVPDGTDGNGITIELTTADLGPPATPQVTVNEQTISVVLNTNSTNPTTASKLVDAINEDTAAQQLVTSRVMSELNSDPDYNIAALVANDPLQIVLGGSNDVVLEPGYVSKGDFTREILFRFKESLPDDTYQVSVFGSGPNALMDADGSVFNDGEDLTIDFAIDLAPQVQSVVPQPVMRNVNGQWEQMSDQVHVYFNDDDLNVTTAETREFYQLIYTRDTLENTDDVVFLPKLIDGVKYYPAADMAVVTFDAPLHSLVDPLTSQPLENGTFRFRVGTDEGVPLVPVQVDLRDQPGVNGLDAGDSFPTALPMGSSLVVESGGEVVVEGDSFRLTDSQGVTKIFEFDPGYILVLPAAGIAGTDGVWDGQRFQVNDVTFEFNFAGDLQNFIDENSDSQPDHEIIAIGREQGVAALVREADPGLGLSADIMLTSTASSVDDFYVGNKVEITAGSGSGIIREITDYDGTSKIATVDAAWGVPVPSDPWSRWRFRIHEDQAQLTEIVREAIELGDVGVTPVVLTDGEIHLGPVTFDKQEVVSPVTNGGQVTAIASNSLGLVVGALDSQLNHVGFEVELVTEEATGTVPSQLIDFDLIILQAHSPVDPNSLVGMTVALTAGSGAGQSRTIVTYDDMTQTATVDQPWQTLPDTDTDYSLTRSQTRVIESYDESTTTATVDVAWTLMIDGTIPNTGSLYTIQAAANITETGTSDIPFGESNSANKMYLAATASSSYEAYTGLTIEITGGTGVGQTSAIYSYDGSNRLATLLTPWTVVPDATSIYQFQMGRARLPILSPASNSAYWGFQLEITAGTGAGQVRTISHYDGASKVATLSETWTTQPDETSQFQIATSDISTTGQPGTQIPGAIPISFVPSAVLTPPEILSQKIAAAISSADFGVRAGVGENNASDRVGLVGVASFDTGPVVAVKADTVSDFLNMDQVEITDQFGSSAIFRLRDFESTVPENPVGGVPVYPVVFFPDMTVEEVLTDLVQTINSTIDFKATASLGSLGIELTQDSTNPSETVSFVPSPDSLPGREMPLAIEFTEGVTGFNLQQLNSFIVRSSIDPQSLPLNTVGAIEEPGHREIRSQRHYLPGYTADSQDGIASQYYNFQEVYALDTQDRPLYNIITGQQKDRAREVFELIGHYAGIQFVETDNQGITVATGDLQAIAQEEGEEVDRTLLGLGGMNSSGNPIAVMDGQDFTASGTDLYGDIWFQTAMKVIQQTLGVGYTDELSPKTLSGDWETNPGDANPFLAGHQAMLVTDPMFPGHQDQIHLQHLYRKDSIDIDVYQFVVSSAGLFTVETIAERKLEASSLDTVLRLYRELTDTNGNVIGRELYAQNDDYFSNDSFLELELLPGVYYIGVSASGNDRYDPSIERTGYGGTSQGEYDLRVTRRPDVDQSIEDSQTGLDLDGDLDGKEGGVYNSWFRTSAPIAADEAREPGVPRILFVDKTSSGSPKGTLQQPYTNINDAFANSVPGDVVRILGNRSQNSSGTEDDTLKALEDIEAYEVGFSRLLGLPLADGAKMQIPQGVTVMVDEGVVIKLRRADIGVGSTDSVVDRSASSLQVYGTPRLLKWNDQWEPVEVHQDLAGHPVTGHVYFTSLHDAEIGQGTNPDLNPPAAEAGDWGGLGYRHRVDRGQESRFVYETEGIFLNSVAFADIRYGGGIVEVDSIPQVVRPIDLTDARPSIHFNQVRFSADAAIGSTPNSSEETNFHAPNYQSISFTSDYSRVGPAIHGNLLVDNSINGHFIVIATPATEDLEQLTVTAKWDDQDVVTVVSENLLIQGTPGGLLMESEVPPVNLVTLTSLDPGEGVGQGTLRYRASEPYYQYRIVFVDNQGHEGVPSAPTASAQVSLANDGQGRIQLDNLPAATGTYVSRRLYRSTTDGSYERIADLNANDEIYTDDGTTRGGILGGSAVKLVARLDASLVVGDGVIVKLDTAYIDVGMGAHMYAEASGINPTVFTSIRDTRYGRGGTFDTAMQGSAQLSAGDWAGIYAHATGRLSLDHVVVAHAGGVARVEGNFAGFNPIEVHQATTRIANSRFEHNLDGQGGQAPESRYGRLFNEEAVIFVRGTEAVIVDNLLLENQAPVISVDVNSMNSIYQDDDGRSTGRHQRNADYDGNQGLLVRGNRLERNDINGIKVRAGVLNTQGVMDETDMTLVVDGPIYVTDLHTVGGLRLESKVTESLVVKFDGPDAGFVVTGMPLDIVDRIGGLIEVLGQPQSPVVLTAFADDRVGNGLKLDGTTQKDTDNQQLGFQFENLTTTENDPLPDALIPWLIDNDVPLAPMTAGQFQYHTGPGGESGTAVDWTDPTTGTALGPYDLGIATAQGRTAMLQQNFINEFLHFISVGDTTVNLSNTNVVTPPQKVAFDRIFSEGNFQGDSGATVTWRVETHMNDGEPIVWNTITFESDAPLGDLRLISYLDQEFGGFVTDPDKPHFGGMLEIDYQLLQTPIQVGTVTGEILVANTVIQTFTQNSGGSFTITDVSGTGAKVSNLTLNPTTGVLTATWTSMPGAHTFSNVTYLPQAQDILKTIGTPGQSDYRVMTLDNDQRVGIQQGGVYQDGSSGLTNGQFIGYAADKHSDLRDRITGADPALPPVMFSFSDNIAVDTTDLPQFFDSDLGKVYGPEDITTAMAWDIDATARTATVTTFLELLPVYPVQDLAGSWNGLQILEHSYDRNVASVLEVEALASVYGDDSNKTADDSQQVGNLAINELSGDENRRLGFTIFADLSGPADVDTFSFTANGATEVWFDIDGTSPSLDTVIELVDAQNNLLARSDNSGDETANSALLDPLTADAGPVILLSAADGSELISSGANPSLPAGDRIVITDDQNSTNIFEFTLDGSTSNASYVPIVYRESMDNTQLVRKIVETINATATTSVTAYQENGRVHLDNDHREVGFRPRIFDAASRAADAPVPLEVVRDHSSVSPELMVGKVHPLAKADFAIDDYGTTNVLDAGMRVILPGEATATNEYFVRVRSASDDLWDLDAGMTQGEYELQIRLRELDEQPGTTIRYADIRNATDGINIVGLPLHSYLVGEIGEIDAPNDDLTNAQDIGNLLTSDVGTLSIAGSLDSATDVDFYHFEVRHEHVTVQDETVPVAIDVDWSSGLERPSTSAILYDADGNVIVIAEGSNIADDRPRPLEGLDLADHSRGTVGYDDPFIGPTDLAVGDYYLAITHQDRAPESVYQQENQLVAVDPLLRLQPNPIYARVIEDHIETVGGGTLDQPQFAITIDANSFTPYHLGDVVSFINSEKALKTANPFTGAWETLADPPLHKFENSFKIDFDDLEIHPVSGEIFAYESDGIATGIAIAGKENIVGAGTYLKFSGDGTAVPATNVAFPWGAMPTTTIWDAGDPNVNFPPVLAGFHGHARREVAVGDDPAVVDPDMAGMVVRAMTFTNFDPRTADGTIVDEMYAEYGDLRMPVYGMAVASRPGAAEVTMPWYGDPLDPINHGPQGYDLDKYRGHGTSAIVVRTLEQGRSGQNEIQQISVSPRPSSGTFNLTFRGIQTDTLIEGQMSDPIAWNTTAAELKQILEASLFEIHPASSVDGIEVGYDDIKVTGGPWPFVPLEIEFLGTPHKDDQPNIGHEHISYGEFDWVDDTGTLRNEPAQNMWPLEASAAELEGVIAGWIGNVFYTFNPISGIGFPFNTNGGCEPERMETGTPEGDTNCRLAPNEGLTAIPFPYAQTGSTSVACPVWTAGTTITDPQFDALRLNCDFYESWGPEQTQVLARGQLDTFADPIGKAKRMLVMREVAEDSQGETELIIEDGMTFSVNRAEILHRGQIWQPTDIKWTFEFNLGPNVIFRHDFDTGTFVEDGDTFTVDTQVVEFDTGPNLVVQAANGQGFLNGDLLVLTDEDAVEITFEFSTTTVDEGNTRIPINSFMSREEITGMIVEVVNEADFGIVSVGGRSPSGQYRIAFEHDHTMGVNKPNFVLAPTSPPGRVAPIDVDGEYGVHPLSVAVPVEESYNSELFGEALVSALSGNLAGVTVSRDGNLVSFSGAIDADFTGLDDITGRGVFSVQNSWQQPGDNSAPIPATGNVAGGHIAVNLLASDNVSEVSRKVKEAIESGTGNDVEARVLWENLVEIGENSAYPSFANDAMQPGDPVDPSPNPPYITPYLFTNSPEELPIGGAGPGGYVTGIASIKGQTYAVSDRGGFYHVYYDPASLNRDAHLTYIPESAAALLGKNIQGLTAGPWDAELFHLPIEDISTTDPIVVTSTRHRLQEGDLVTIEGVEGNTAANGDFTVSNVTTNTFELYDLDGEAVETNGLYAPSSIAFIYKQGDVDGPYEEMLFAVDGDGTIFAVNSMGAIQEVFVDAQSTAATEYPDVTAISFSDLSRNLWHFEKEEVQEPAAPGGNMSDAGHRYTSYDARQDETIAGFDQPAASEYNSYIAFSDVQFDVATESTIGDQYDFAGGAHGSVETNPFSLIGYSPADQPYFYFDYKIASADEDAFRVFVGDDSGIWRLLSSNQTADVVDDVQQLFNNTATWRQNRVSLAAYAGRDNIRLRFDFDTAADTNVGDAMTTGTSLRLIAPADISDGEIFILDGTVVLNAEGHPETVSDGGVVFEFDRGTTIVAPSGKSIVSGRTFQINYGDDHWAFEFLVEDSIPTSGFEPIYVNDCLTPRQVAQRIEGALMAHVSQASATFQVVEQDLSTGGFVHTENNDTLETAFDKMTLTNGSGDFQFENWSIGDNQGWSSDPGLDVDLIRVPMNAGSTITVDVDAAAVGLTTTLDSYLRIFDATGRELASNDVGLAPDDDVASTDSYLEFTAPRSNDYYIGVSGNANTDYNPLYTISGTPGTTGAYNLTVNLADTVPTFTRLGAQINIPYADSISSDDVEGLILPVDGSKGSTVEFNGLPSVPIFIHLGMDDHDVAKAVQVAIAGALANDHYEVVKTHNDAVNIIGHDVTYAGSLGTTVTMPGDPEEDEFGVGYYSVDRALDNAHDGVWLDNLVVGFAETGNIVESSTGAAGTMTPQFQGQAELPDVLTGEYQVEIRYVQQDKLQFDHSLDTNQRFTQSKTLEASDGSDLYDGQTFVIGDGVREITFEYDEIERDNGVQPGHQQVPYDPAYSATEVARAVWNSINSAAVQGMLDVQAGPANGGLLTEASDHRVNLYGNAVIDVASSTLTIDTDKSANELRDVLLGSGVSAVGNAELVGGPVSAGQFSGNRNILGMPGGVVLSTGRAIDVTQANTVDNLSGISSGKSDTELNKAFSLDAVAGSTVDTTALEFEIDLESDDLYISYVFASEEYSDPATGYTDVMGVLVDANSDGSFENIAVVPTDTTNAIRSNTITGGYPLGVGAVNSQYFINNDADLSNTSSKADIAFDGFTTVLTAVWEGIGAGHHTIRLAVADVKTPDVDSALFLLENGISGEPLECLDLLGEMLGTRVELKGHSNTERHQGQLLIESNNITNSSGYGIVVDSGPVDAQGRAHPGAPRNLRQVNNEGFVPGVAVVNNILSFNETGGIHFSGDVNASSLLRPAVPFGRIINNTVVGDVDTGVGIQVTDFASPTVLNNIVTNAQIGLDIDATSNTTVVGGTLYGPNTTNFSNTTIGSGQSPIYLTASDPLFVAPENGNFYLEAGSKAVDSSLDSLQDRSALVAVKTPMGISVSPILAPDLDAYGQLRVDDPSANTSSGVGETPFVDRGAIDRVDHYSPWAILVDPVDWTGVENSEHLDQDPTATIVDLVHVAQEQFVIQLQDGRVAPDPVDGTGIEDSSVSSGSFAVYQDDERLTINEDYLFSYNDNSNTIYLTSLAGVWSLDATYRIELSNVQGFEIRPEDGSHYTDGDQFLIEDYSGNQSTFEFESGYNLQVRESLALLIPTAGGLEITDGETFAVNDGSRLQIFEMDRNGVTQQGNQAIVFQVSETVDQVAASIVTVLASMEMDVSPVNLGEGKIHIGSTIDHQLIVSGDTDFISQGDPASVADGGLLTVDNGLQHVTFEFNRDQEVLDASEVPGVHEVVQFDLSMTHEELANILVNEIVAAGLGLSPVHLGEGRIHIGGGLNHQISTANTYLTHTGEPGVTGSWGLRVPSQGGKVGELIADEDVFSISDGTNAPVIFEFDSNQDAIPTNRTVPFTADSTADQIAWLIAAEIRASVLGATLDPAVAGNGILVLGGTSSHEMDVMESSMIELGLPGEAGANAVALVEDESYTTGDVSLAIANGVNAATDLENVFAVARFDTVSIEGAAAVSGLDFLDSPAITDRAGNVLQPNQLDGDTSFVIKLSAGRDYGDAPDSYGTTKANNGAGHLIVDGFHLGDTVDSEPNGAPTVNADGDGADDDGVQFGSLRVGYDANVLITVEGVRDGRAGKLDAWVDWDDDGGWESGDRIADGFEVQVYPGQDSTDLTQSWCEEDQNELGRWTCNIAFPVPGSIVPRAEFSAYTRVRLSSGGVGSPTGNTVDGEVEDGYEPVSSNPWQNGNNVYDVNNNGTVSPSDALAVINYLNNIGLGALPVDFSVGDGPETHGRIDVDGNGLASPNDVLQVINRLNELINQTGGGEGEGGEGEAPRELASSDKSVGSLGGAFHSFDTLSLSAVPFVTSDDALGNERFGQEVGDDSQADERRSERQDKNVSQDDYRRPVASSTSHRDAQAITSPWWLDNSRLDDLDGILDEIGSDVDQLQDQAASRDDIFADWLN